MTSAVLAAEVWRTRPRSARARRRKRGFPELYEARSSLRGLARTFGVSRNTVSAWLKQALTLLARNDTLLEPAEFAPVELELDELGSFVRHKGNKRWIWLALCQATRQVGACVVGGRGKASAVKQPA